MLSNIFENKNTKYRYENDDDIRIEIQYNKTDKNKPMEDWVVTVGVPIYDEFTFPKYRLDLDTFERNQKQLDEDEVYRTYYETVIEERK